MYWKIKCYLKPIELNRDFVFYSDILATCTYIHVLCYNLDILKLAHLHLSAIFVRTYNMHDDTYMEKGSSFL